MINDQRFDEAVAKIEAITGRSQREIRDEIARLWRTAGNRTIVHAAEMLYHRAAAGRWPE